MNSDRDHVGHGPLGDDFHQVERPAQWIGLLLVALVIVGSYRWVSRQSELGPG